MTNDQFTEWLEESIAYCEIAKCSEHDVLASAFKSVLERYRQLAPTWIPVTPDTMPEENGHYLVYVRAMGRAEMAYLDIQTDGYMWLGCVYASTITHWQPLPAPPTK